MYNTIKEALAATTATPKTKKQSQGHNVDRERDEDPESQTAKLGEDSEGESVVGDLKFTLGAVPKHNEMGFMPYFNKKIRKLKGPIPLTIFKKTWKNTAILYHSEKQAKTEETLSNRNHYTGFPYPSEWTQTFAEWTTNHQGFYQTLVTKYGYKKFAKWLLAHKANANAILVKDGFMTALRYNVQIANSAYATCRKFKELEFPDNPYAESGTRVNWDPTTGNPRGKRKATPKASSSTTSTTPTQPTAKAKVKAP
ncbi:hypothetical protein PCANC_13714 [Puccinia coronata f. sp. avenae]|uniref:Uncharacterized protein n=1 Tax=Puccinia coronata f. sp. avenae TaxID=200324 RepID=A0A2N5SFX7_9BASI|nr:hypothetical protein PCASD_24273 [Puccinia coronata f. sp. avenae]PLW48818.1 hypothetical protein PCANC_13714 [Puccinia coronata f. sp. avenae]